MNSKDYKSLRNYNQTIEKITINYKTVGNEFLKDVLMYIALKLYVKI